MTRPPLRAFGRTNQSQPHSAGISARLVLACLAAPRRRRSALIAGLLMACFGQSASAQTSYSWTTAASGNWNASPSNWTPTSGPGTTFPVAGDTATFNATGVNGAETVFLNGNEAAASLTFANTGATTISTGVSGTQVNNQSLTLTGGVTINSGAGAVAIGQSVANNNVLIIANGSQSFTNNSANTFNIGNGSSTTTISLQGGGTSPNIITFAGSGNITMQGVIKDGAGGGTVSVIKNGAGTLELDSAATLTTFSGGITLNAGLLSLKSSNALGTSANTLTINGGTVASNASARTLPAAISLVIGGDFALGTGTSGGLSITFNGPVDLGGATRNIVLNNSATFSGAITDGGFTKVNSSIVGNGATTLTLGSTGNTYAGPTIINAGTLSVAGSNDLSPNSALTLANGTTLALGSGSAETIASLSDGGANPGGGITMGNATGNVLTTGSDNTNTSFSGVFSGTDTNNNGGLVKVGTGTFTLTGASTFNGAIAVNNGTLAFTTIGNVGAASSSLFAPANATIGTIALGSTTTTGTLQFVGAAAASSDRVINLAGTTGGATLDASGTVTAATITYTSNLTATGVGAKTLTLTGTNTGANTLAGSIPDSSSGATSLTKAGSGTWVLSGTSSYSGPTAVNNGILSVTGMLAGPGAVTVAAGTPFGTLAGNGTIAGAVTVSDGLGGPNGVISPGTLSDAGLDTLTLTGGLTLPGTYNATVDPDNSASSDLAITGNLNLTGADSTLNLSFTDGDPVTGTYTLATFTGTLTGTFADINNLPSGYAVDYNPNSITLAPSAVPEPASSLLLGFAGVSGLGWWRRRRNGQHA